MTVEKSRDTQKGSRRGEEDLAKEVTTKRIFAARKGRKVYRTVMTDSCIPLWKPPSLAKDLQTLFGGPSEPIEKETRSAVACMEEIEAARVKVYPRISDFQIIE